MTEPKIDISLLKEQLHAAKNKERSQILAKIETYKTEGDHEIRVHQKDVDFRHPSYSL